VKALRCGQFLLKGGVEMKGSLKVSFTGSEILSMRLRSGIFSLSRFKRLFRNKVRKLITDRQRDVPGTDRPETWVDVGRVAVRQLSKERPKNFLVDVSYLSDGVVFRRETFRYVFENPQGSLNGFLVSRRQCHAKR